jgi:hypothetical protein
MIWQMCNIVIILIRLVKILLQRRTYQQGGSIMSRNANIQFPLIGILEKYINA